MAYAFLGSIELDYASTLLALISDSLPGENPRSGQFCDERNVEKEEFRENGGEVIGQWRSKCRLTRKEMKRDLEILHTYYLKFHVKW